jgi:hypothetical protein
VIGTKAICAWQARAQHTSWDSTSPSPSLSNTRNASIFTAYILLYTFGALSSGPCHGGFWALSDAKTSMEPLSTRARSEEERRGQSRSLCSTRPFFAT